MLTFQNPFVLIARMMPTAYVLDTGRADIFFN